MNKIKYTILAGFLLSILYSCDSYLDRELSTDLTYNEVTRYYSYSRSRVAAVYARIAPGFLNINDAMMASATDEAEHTIESSSIQMFNLGSWNAYSNPDNAWPTYYKAIRDANLVLVSLDSIDFDIYKYDPRQQQVYQARLEEVNRWKYEIRFLRAYFYFELVKRYGGVPILTEAIANVNDNFNNIKRNTLEQCIKFITDECDSTAKVLPVRYGSDDLGRATSIAALALKSRILLYQASDLWNTPAWAESYADNALISISGNRVEMWKKAADAAKAVIELAEGNGYYIHPDYNSLFGSTNFTNDEILFARRDGDSYWFERLNYSIGFNLGQSGTTPSQNLVDAYETLNGKNINSEGSGYDKNDPYSNRDPRLKYSILTNDICFKGRNMEMWNGGKDAPPIANATKTGYYLRKYVNENLNLLTNQTSVHSWVIFRLAEFYLNYAEALNEYSPGHKEIKESVDKIRQRENVGLPPLPDGLSQDEMRNSIRNERRVEFAFEDHRAWDLRRWMSAVDILNAPLQGMKVTKKQDNTFIYEPVKVEDRVFSPKMYFYPIPQNEVMIVEGIVQNPLW